MTGDRDGRDGRDEHDGRARADAAGEATDVGEGVGEGEDYAALVRGLVRDLAGTSITRLELRHGDLRVALRRKPGAAPATAFAAPEEAEGAGRPPEWRAVVAPLTGIYYGRPSPDEETYVRVGGRVEPDSIVGLIESMKMFNEVTADIAGTVREVVVENGAIVEAGQPILYVEPGETVEDSVAAGA